MTGFQLGVQIFSSKKPTKLGTFRQISQKLNTKSGPFGFNFSKGSYINLRVQIPIIFKGAGGLVVGLKMEHLSSVWLSYAPFIGNPVDNPGQGS